MRRGEAGQGCNPKFSCLLQGSEAETWEIISSPNKRQLSRTNTMTSGERGMAGGGLFQRQRIIKLEGSHSQSISDWCLSCLSLKIPREGESGNHKAQSLPYFDIRLQGQFSSLPSQRRTFGNFGAVVLVCQSPCLAVKGPGAQPGCTASWDPKSSGSFDTLFNPPAGLKEVVIEDLPHLLEHALERIPTGDQLGEREAKAFRRQSSNDATITPD